MSPETQGMSAVSGPITMSQEGGGALLVHIVLVLTWSFMRLESLSIRDVVVIWTAYVRGRG